MSQETINALIKAGEVMTLAIAVLGGIVAVIISLKSQNRNTGLSEALVKSQGQLIDVIQDFDETTKENTKLLAGLNGLFTNFLERVTRVEQELSGAVTEMKGSVAVREAQLAEMPGKLSIEMENNLPPVIVKAIQPYIEKIESLQAVITDEFASLNAKLNEMAEQTIPEKTSLKVSQPIREVLDSFQKNVDAQIKAIAETVQRLAQDEEEKKE